MENKPSSINRRAFLQQSACATGLITAGVAGLSRPAAAQKQANPFAYDVERFSKVDPKLIQYRQTGRFACGIARPRRLALGPHNRLYVAGQTGVAVMDSSGAMVRNLTLPAPGRSVAVASDGFVYAGCGDHVEVFNASGKREATWEPLGKKSWITGIALSPDAVFAADSGGRVIVHYDRAGKILARIGVKNTDRNIPGLIVPSPYLHVAMAPDGLLRVNNPGRHRVEAYTTAGDLEFFWGKASAAIEGFCGCCNPISIALLPDGRCVTCEKGFARVKIYSAEGVFQCVIAGPDSFPENAKAGAARDPLDGTMGGLDAAVDARGNVYVLDLVAGDIRVFATKSA